MLYYSKQKIWMGIDSEGPDPKIRSGYFAVLERDLSPGKGGATVEYTYLLPGKVQHLQPWEGQKHPSSQSNRTFWALKKLLFTIHSFAL